MSTETEKDLERQIEEHEEAIVEYQKLQRIKTNKVADLRTSLKVIRETPKKPELRHGDFGLYSSQLDALVTEVMDGFQLWNKYHYPYPDGRAPDIHKILGNIFDLMEQAGPSGVIVALTKEEAEYVGQQCFRDYYPEVSKKVKAALDRQK